jgi:hypothetical protein
VALSRQFLTTVATAKGQIEKSDSKQKKEEGRSQEISNPDMRDSL